MNSLKKYTKKTYLGIILLFQYAPIFILMAFSFNDSKSRAVWAGFTFKWYASLFENDNIREALYITLTIALLSSIIATIIGTFAAIGIEKYNKVAKRAIMSITNIPVVSPDIVTGASLMILFVFTFNILNFGRLGFTTMLCAHITFNIPFVILSVLPRLKQIDNNLYEAALDLGATPSKAFFKVLLPELMPGVVTGFLLAFTMSIDDFVISFFTCGQGINNLSTIIYSMSKKGISPEINALSTIMFIVVIIMLYIINLRNSRIKSLEERNEK